MSKPPDVPPSLGDGAAPSASSPYRAAPAPEAPPASLVRPLAAAAITTALVTAVSYLAPDRYAATLVGVTFLAATWWLVLRHDEHVVRAHGLSLGGILEPTPIDPRRILRASLGATGWALLFVVLAFPLFWVGYRFYWHPSVPFTLRMPPSLFDELAGQLVVIALPEEAFFRGYLQTSLDRVWRPRWRILGADLGPAWLLSAAIFAIGHLLTIRHPGRLAVFFPALLFGWMRVRTKGVGAPVLFHALCNIFSAALGRGYGLS